MNDRVLYGPLMHNPFTTPSLNALGSAGRIFTSPFLSCTSILAGSKGQLLEWNEEFEETEPGHRHMSHLYGLFPSELFAGEVPKTKPPPARQDKLFPPEISCHSDTPNTYKILRTSMPRP